MPGEHHEELQHAEPGDRRPTCGAEVEADDEAGDDGQ